jgi:hypothetical protein
MCPPFLFGSTATGLPWAKNKILIVRDKAAWRAMMTISKILAVFASVDDTTGYMFLNKNRAETANPMATKSQFRIVSGDAEAIETGTQIKFA